MTAAHAIRDDGHINNFTVSGSSLVAEPGVALRLQAVGSGYQLTDESDSVETYDASGKLLSVADRAGNLQTMVYGGPAGALSGVTDNLGHSLSLGYDSTNRLRTVTGPDGTVTYDYDAAGHLWKITAADGSYHQFLYQDPNWPTGISSRIDENGDANLIWQYDSQGRVQTAKLGGITTGLSFSYNADGTTTETDPLGAKHIFGAQQIGNHMLNTGVTGDPCAPCGFSKAISYDTGGFPASVTDYNNNVTLFTYDDVRGLELSRTEAHTTAQARTITTSWHSTYRLPMQISEYAGETATGTALRTTTYTYDSTGNLLTASVQDGASQRTRTTTYSDYTATGLPQTIDGPRTDLSDVTARAYYPIVAGDPKSGQLKSITDALGHVRSYDDYDGSGRLLQATDANGQITKLGYDAKGQLHTVTTGTQLTTLTYWPTGQLKQVALPSGSALNYAYNAAHQLTDITNQLGEHIQITPDAMGNATKTEVFDSTATLVQTHTRQYNTLNQLAWDIGAYNNESTAYTYDDNGNLKTVTDPLLHKTTNTYDPLDRLSKITDPKQYNTLFGINTLDQLTKVTDPRQLVTMYTLDGLDNLSQTQSPDSGATTQPQIDDAGNVLQRKDAKGQSTGYQYDALNRLAKITRSDSSTVVFTYDQNDSAHGYGIGRLTSMTDPSGSTDWTYDQYGHVTKKIQKIGATSLTTKYSYEDATGHLLTITYPSTKVVGTTWTNGQVTALTLGGSPLVSNIVYQPFGGPISWLLANGETDTRTYDLDGRISGDPVETIGYDLSSRIMSLTFANHNAVVGSQTFGYDENDRVTSNTGNGGPVTYTYDANDNRSTEIVNGKTTTYTIDPASNRVTKASTGLSRPAYTYDTNGSLISFGTNKYGYDPIGRLISFQSGLTTTTYSYDGLGQRVSKANRKGTVVFVYDEAGQLIGEYSGAGIPAQETFYLGSIPISTTIASKLYAIHADYRNAPRQLDDPTRAAVWTWNPLPFGETDPVSTGVTYNLRFPGQYYDTESGLYQNGFRDYDPTIGRYVESDPIGLRGGVNSYVYGLANPLRWTDPTGNCPWCVAIWLFLTENSVAIGTTVAIGGEIATGVQTPISGPVAFTGRAAQELIYDVYLGFKNGAPIYAGISRNLVCRTIAHGSRFDAFQKLTSSPVTRDQARAIEQALIKQNPQFENEINSISPTRPWYEEAVNYGQQFLREHGF